MKQPQSIRQKFPVALRTCNLLLWKYWITTKQISNFEFFKASSFQLLIKVSFFSSNCQIHKIPVFHQAKSSHLYLFSAFNNTNCVKATAQYQNRNIFELKAFHYWIQWCHCPAQFSLNSICAIKSVISLEIKCPQLSKPEATTARNQNSMGDRWRKKPWEKPGSVGGPVPLRPDEPVVCFNCSKVRV